MCGCACSLLQAVVTAALVDSALVGTDVEGDLFVVAVVSSETGIAIVIVMGMSTCLVSLYVYTLVNEGADTQFSRRVGVVMHVGVGMHGSGYARVVIETSI